MALVSVGTTPKRKGTHEGEFLIYLRHGEEVWHPVRPITREQIYCGINPRCIDLRRVEKALMEVEGFGKGKAKQIVSFLSGQIED